MEFNPYPKHIAIIGGGRWARVIIEVLCEIVPDKTIIYIYSLSNWHGMSKWAKVKNFKQNIKVLKKISNVKGDKIEAAIVVNSAKDHELSTKTLLINSIPVLVEKPLSLSYLSTKNLINLANNTTFLCSAHVFLFAKYIFNFSNHVKKSGVIKSIYIEWKDQKNENRYGETKSYDSGLPVYYDCLPHVLSIISSVVCLGEVIIHNVSLFRGGSKVNIKFNLSGIECEVELERNSELRSRLFSVQKENQKSVLNFSDEPTFIMDGNNIVESGDEIQDLKDRPVASMLNAFMDQLRSGKLDARLNPSLALYANKFIEQVSHSYNQEVLLLLKRKLLPPALIDDDLRYILSELLSFNQSINSSKLEYRIESVQNAFSGSNSDYWHKNLNDKSPFDTIRQASSILD